MFCQQLMSNLRHSVEGTSIFTAFYREAQKILQSQKSNSHTVTEMKSNGKEWQTKCILIEVCNPHETLQPFRVLLSSKHIKNANEAKVNSGATAKSLDLSIVLQGGKTGSEVEIQSERDFTLGLISQPRNHKNRKISRFPN